MIICNTDLYRVEGHRLDLPRPGPGAEGGGPDGHRHLERHLGAVCVIHTSIDNNINAKLIIMILNTTTIMYH